MSIHVHTYIVHVRVCVSARSSLDTHIRVHRVVGVWCVYRATCRFRHTVHCVCSCHCCGCMQHTHFAPLRCWWYCISTKLVSEVWHSCIGIYTYIYYSVCENGLLLLVFCFSFFSYDSWVGTILYEYVCVQRVNWRYTIYSCTSLQNVDLCWLAHHTQQMRLTH